MAAKYYVKKINDYQIALFWDAALTLPATVDFTKFENEIFVSKLQSTSTAITYSDFPPGWAAIDWPITWINSSVTLSWTNSGSTITWKNTL